jgi:hypothetical protein
MLVLEAQPQLLERVPVVADTPRHRVLTVVERLQLQLVPREGLLAVEQVRALRIARVPVDRDTDQVSGDGRVAGVEQLATLPAVDLEDGPKSHLTNNEDSLWSCSASSARQVLEQWSEAGHGARARTPSSCRMRAPPSPCRDARA